MKSTSRNLLRIACLAVMFVLAMTYAGITRSASPAGANCVTPPSGMIGWWPGDGYPNDLAGTNHGTLLNGVTFAPGKVGQVSASSTAVTSRSPITRP